MSRRRRWRRIIRFGGIRRACCLPSPYRRRRRRRRGRGARGQRRSSRVHDEFFANEKFIVIQNRESVIKYRVHRITCVTCNKC